MDVYEQLAKAGAKVTYFCAYCNYVFGNMPKLPTKCPKCSRRLTGFSKPVVEPTRLRVAL